ncbi:MAG: histidine kinase [Chloroflexota bacterium]
MKRASRSASQIEQLLFFLRLITLLVIGVEIFFNPKSNLITSGVVLGLAALYSLALIVITFSGMRLTVLPTLELVADSIFAVLIFGVSGGSLTVMMWAMLFPVAASALRVGWIRSVAAAMLIALINVAVLIAFDLESYLKDFTLLIPFASSAALLLIGASLIGIVGERMKLLAVKRTHAERDVDEKRSKYVREQARIVYDMASLVSATLNYEKVFDAALDRCGQVMADTGAASSQMISVVMVFQEGVLHVITARRLTQADMKVTLSAASGVLAETVNGGESVLSSQPYRDPELSNFVALRNCRTVMTAPLEAGADHYGVMIFAHPRADFFDLDHIELLEAICKHIVIAMQNAKLYQRLIEEKERIVEVEEEARKKLARDLHDGPTQSVAAIAMRANFIRRLLEREPKSAAEEIYKLEELARKTTKEIRHMLFTLRPLILESQGLAAALQSLADKMRENFNQNVIIEADATVSEQMDMHTQGVLFYIVEETVGNARKHAQAAHIWVRLKMRQTDVAALEIQDDGVGFDVKAVMSTYESRGSMGMVNLRERTELVSGDLKIDSAPGKGTKITILVPLSDEAKQRLMG